MGSAEKIAILGYGSQGRAWALNIRDSGGMPVIGLPAGSRSVVTAGNEGFPEVLEVPEAVEKASIIVFAFPDHLHGRVYDESIRQILPGGAALVFLHGFAIHFGAVKPPETCDTILLAPLGPGQAVRDKYARGESVRYFYAIHRDGTGRAGERLGYLMKVLKIDESLLLETTFRDEAVGDLFGEQAVLCGGLSQLIKAGYDTLLEYGLSPEKAFLEVAFQLDLIVSLIKEYGLAGMFERISVAAQFGSLTSGPRIIDASVKTKMKEILKDIESGRFARELNSLSDEDLARLKAKISSLTTPSFESAAEKFSSKKQSG